MGVPLLLFRARVRVGRGASFSSLGDVIGRGASVFGGGNLVGKAAAHA